MLTKKIICLQKHTFSNIVLLALCSPSTCFSDLQPCCLISLLKAKTLPKCCMGHLSPELGRMAMFDVRLQMKKEDCSCSRLGQNPRSTSEEESVSEMLRSCCFVSSSQQIVNKCSSFVKNLIWNNKKPKHQLDEWSVHNVT